MRPLRILHTDFHRGWGGQAARVLMLSGELARRGHRVTIAAPAGELTRRATALAKDTAGLEVDDGFSFRSPGHAISFLRDLTRLRGLVARREFDVIDSHGSQDTWIAAAARWSGGLPGCFVMTRHNTKRVRTNSANRMLYGRLIDHLILVDESIRGLYAPFLDRGGLSTERISVISSAYRADLFHDRVDGHRARRELGLPDGAVVVGVAGRLVTDKGHIHLMRAAAELIHERPGLVLVFAGAGPQRDRLETQARELGLSQSIRFLGFRADIAEVQAAFDVAVLPSVGCDASSASLKEAMALGVPVIATDIGGARGILRHGETGLIVRPGSHQELAAALRALLADPDRARAMARRAQSEVSARFSLSRLADETLGAYATAMARTGRLAQAPARVTA